MRILHLTTFVQGGAGLVLAQLAAAQRAQGHRVVVVTSRAGVPGYGNYEGHLTALAAADVPVHTVDSLFSRRPEDHRSVVRLVDDVLGGADAFDVMHTHAAEPTRIALDLNARARRPRPALVQTMHGWGVRKTPEQQSRDVAAMRAADRVVVPSDHSRALMAVLGVPSHLLHTIGYGVDAVVCSPPAPDPLRRDMREWRLRGGEVLCAVGTVGARKNQRRLVDALASLADLRSLLTVIVGDGETDALAEHVSRLDLDERVRVVGYRADARVVAAAADYFVLPSLSEGQPLSILEAWADGVPVLCSRTPELVELTEGGESALLFDPHDVDDIARAVASVRHASPASRQRLIERARAQYRARFTLDRMVDAYAGAYASALATKRLAA